MDNNNHIDDIFRSKLKDYKPEYNPEHWQMMKTAISSSGKTATSSSGSFTSMLLIIASAVIIVSSGIYTYNLTQKNNSADSNNKNIASVNPSVNAAHGVANTHDISKSAKTSPASAKNDVQTVVAKSNAVNNNPTALSNNTSALADNSSAKNNKDVKTKDVPSTAKTDYKNSVKNITQDASASVKISSGKTNNSVENNNSKVENSSTKIAGASNGSIDNSNSVKPNINQKEVAAETLNSKNNTVQATQLNDEKTNVSVVTNNESKSIEPLAKTESSDNKKEEVVSDNNNGDNNNYSSVADDYLNQKQKLDQKHKKMMEHKAAKANCKEAIPDCKVAMVNNFVSNPAFAGFNQRHTITLSTLIHKPLYKPTDDFNIPFEYSLAYDFNFGKRKNYGVGIDYKRFLGAAEGSLAVDLTFSYKINIAAHHNIRLGVSASYLVSDVNKDNLTFPDMIDSQNGFVHATKEFFPTNSAKSNFDLGAGVYYSWKTLFVGFSATHLTSPEVGIISNARIPRQYLLSAGYGVEVKKNLNILPAVEAKYDGILLSISPAMLFTYRKWLLMGVEFQNLKNAGLVLGFNVKNNFILNLHGGIPMSKDIINNFGAIDYAGISLRFQFGNYR